VTGAMVSVMSASEIGGAGSLVTRLISRALNPASLMNSLRSIAGERIKYICPPAAVPAMFTKTFPVDYDLLMDPSCMSPRTFAIRNDHAILNASRLNLPNEGNETLLWRSFSI
jgi:hypothetical protein